MLNKDNKVSYQIILKEWVFTQHATLLIRKGTQITQR